MSLEQETDVGRLRQAIRPLEQENRKLIEVNLQLRAGLAEAKGERAEQLKLGPSSTPVQRATGPHLAPIPPCASAHSELVPIAPARS